MSEVKPMLWNVAVLLVCVLLAAVIFYVLFSSLSAVNSSMNITEAIA